MRNIYAIRKETGIAFNFAQPSKGLMTSEELKISANTDYKEWRHGLSKTEAPNGIETLRYQQNATEQQGEKIMSASKTVDKSAESGIMGLKTDAKVISSEKYSSRGIELPDSVKKALSQLELSGDILEKEILSLLSQNESSIITSNGKECIYNKFGVVVTMDIEQVLSEESIAKIKNCLEGIYDD